MPVTSEDGESEPAARRQPPSPTRRRLPRAEVEEGESEGGIDEESIAGSATPAAGGISEAAFSPKFFVTERELGRGGTGVVLLVRHLLDGVSLGHFACKRVPVGDNHKWLEKVLMEVQLLQQLSHTNLVSYRHVWLENVHLTTFGPSVPCAFILQQYCNSGDLHNYVLSAAKQTTTEQLKDQMRRRSRGEPDLSLGLNKPRKLSFEQIISFFRDIASGLNHLHSNGFIHRDLKPSNCLLNDTGVPGQGLRVLVSDFGEVQMESAARKSTGATGTISYCAPEVLRKVTPDGGYENFTAKSDIFSLGMILYFMCFGNLPYVGADMMNEENENLDALREEIMAWPGLDERTRLRPDLPERLYQSLMTLISPDPSVRPTAEEILLGIEMQEGTPLVRIEFAHPNSYLGC
ncbi:kinase-like domain-containing protein [Tuber indicum]|nr:kinase-like domain-containing protein [Tuber indicum]